MTLVQEEVRLPARATVGGIFDDVLSSHRVSSSDQGAGAANQQICSLGLGTATRIQVMAAGDLETSAQDRSARLSVLRVEEAGN
jgi:hypothetical protein